MPRRGGSSVGQSSGLIIRRSEVRGLPAPPATRGGPMDVDRAADARYERGDDARFQGEVWIRTGPAGPDGTNVAVVSFAPGARTRWHRHPGGQFLYGLSGRGRVRSRDDATGHVLVP